MRFINKNALYNATGIKGWWAYVQHGMGLSGFMSVPGWVSRSSKGYIGSSRTYDLIDKPWGSHPKIDNHIYWSNLQVVHDCFNLTRQDKLKLIISEIEAGKTTPFLRVCYSSTGGKNCCKCEKCCRTMVGLLVLGADYHDYGFDLNQEALILNTKSGFKENTFKFNDGIIFHWEDIVKTINPKNHYQDKATEEFVYWLENYDFKMYAEIQKKKKKRRKIIRKYVGLIPGLPPLAKYIKGCLSK